MPAALYLSLSTHVCIYQTRFQEYIAFLEEHEAVEDTMLFPMVKALFPQSAEDLDRILDPERHRSVDAVNAGVGRLLQQLHERQIALNEMSLSSQVSLFPDSQPHSKTERASEREVGREGERREPGLTILYTNNSQEMRRVVDALERLNDYMVGHIRYEEEATMPWLRQASVAVTGLRRPPIAV